MEGDIASFFVKDLGWALASKMSRPSQALKEVNTSQAFTVGRKKTNHFCSDQAASRFSEACWYKVLRKYSKNWLRETNIKSYLTPKIDSTLKSSNYDAKPWFLHFIAQKSVCPHRFWEIDPEILQTYLMCPCRAFCQWVFLAFAFFRWKCGIP